MIKFYNQSVNGRLVVFLVEKLNVPILYSEAVE